MTYKTKADKAFDVKLEQLLHPSIIMSMSISEFAQPLREPFDWEAVERLFTQYGAYFDLIAEHEFDDLEHFSYEFEWTRLDGDNKTLQLVGHGEPSVEEEQTALLDGTIEEAFQEMSKWDEL